MRDRKFNRSVGLRWRDGAGVASHRADEETGILSREALQSGFGPAVRFRCVKETTGCTWSEVRTLGASWVVLSLLQKCRRPGAQVTVLPIRSAR